jgi:hypothetical protein
MRFKTGFITTAMMVLMAALISSEQVQARAWDWATRLPINQYTPEDIAILKQRMGEILSTLKDGETGKWSNPQTGHGGSITPMTSVQQDNKPCRQTRFKSDVNAQEYVSEFFLCRQADGVWAVEQPLVQ